MLSSGSDNESETMILTEKVLATKMEHEWKLQHTGMTEKLEDWFNMEVQNDVNKKVPAIMDNTAPVDEAITTAVGKNSSGVDNITELSSTDDEHEVNFLCNATVANDNNSPCISTKDDLDVKFPASMTTLEDLLSDDLSQS